MVFQNLDIKQNEAYQAQLDKLNAFGLYEAFLPLINGAPTDRTDFTGPSAITNAWYQVGQCFLVAPLARCVDLESRFLIQLLLKAIFNYSSPR